MTSFLYGNFSTSATLKTWQDSVDTTIAGLGTMSTQSTASYGALAGTNTWTGVQTFGDGTGTAFIKPNGAAGSARAVRYYSNLSLRWDLRVDGVAEGGSNAGSNFGIRAYDDAGASLGDVLTANRATGVVAIKQEEMWSWYIGTVADGTFKMVVNIPYGCTINSITTISAAGTSTLTGKINTTALGGTANSVSTTESTQTHSTANTVVAGDDFQLTFASTSACTGCTVTVKVTRAV